MTALRAPTFRTIPPLLIKRIAIFLLKSLVGIKEVTVARTALPNRASLLLVVVLAAVLPQVSTGPATADEQDQFGALNLEGLRPVDTLELSWSTKFGQIVQEAYRAERHSDTPLQKWALIHARMHRLH